MPKISDYALSDNATGSLWSHWDGTKYNSLSGSGLDTQLGNFSAFVSSSLYTGQYSASDGWSEANRRKLLEWCSETDVHAWTDLQNDRGVSPPAIPRHQPGHTGSIWLDSWERDSNL